MPRSLHGRMLAVSAFATLVALALAGAAIAAVLERFVTEGMDRRLDAKIALLASVVDAEGRVDRAALSARIPALEDGPGWRWRIVAPAGAVASADFPTLADGPPRAPGPPPPPLAPPGAGIRPLDGAREDGVAVHARQLTLATRGGAVTLTAAAPRAVAERPLRAAMMPLLLALAAVAGVMGAAVIVQLRVGLRPVRRLRGEVAAIRRGARTRISEDQPSELQPLAQELNALAAENEAALAAARATAANLAHALTTPVATLAIDLRDRPAQAAQVARIDATIRHHLARARADATNRRAATPLAPAVEGVVAAIARLHAGRGVAIGTSVAAVAVAVEAQDLDELLGNLIDNAARHAASTVTVTAARTASDPRRIRLAIADDGPGIPAAERARVAQPGTRLDERGDGHGFGLSIAGDLVTLYGGTMTLGEAARGGLLVDVVLPAA